LEKENQRSWLGDKEALPASAFLFQRLRSCKVFWMGGEIIMSRKGKF
jgi:hypothetical protein